ncbi:hypothetical protein [Paludibacterium purpuratum]|uniref:Polar amino acid transport system substrate-binding protein n=1 Tax=Paludibacterium purpuratum TaxID=1144873 RepID=A0A4R7BBS8_9NEIS|nr:hypothetical protein [Paludibacterium purpuratum]TDR82113.1 polar amino acid transport system substrate-binding protein [Paludibacterium purpuratum]
MTRTLSFPWSNTMRPLNVLSLFILLFPWLFIRVGGAAEPVTPAPTRIAVYYNVRAPYVVSKPDGTISGLTGTPTTQAFHAAHIPVAWVQMPSNRQLMAIEENLSPACSVGWFKNAERVRFAKFTKPIYRDRPTIGLINTASTIPRPPIALAALLQNTQLRVLIKEGYSYGPYVDRLLQKSKAVPVPTSMDNLVMVRMVALRHADMMFAAEEEAAVLLQQSGIDAARFRILHFTDMPDGEQRYLLCSRAVPDQVIRSLNAVIPPLAP